MKKIPFNPEWKWEQYMEKAISLLFESEGVYMLKNWGNSKGARIEYAIAKEMNIKILFQG